LLPEVHRVIENHRSYAGPKEPRRRPSEAVSIEELASHPDRVGRNPTRDRDAVEDLVNIPAAVPGQVHLHAESRNDHGHPEPAPLVTPACVLKQPQKYVSILVSAFVLEDFQLRCSVLSFLQILQLSNGPGGTTRTSGRAIIGRVLHHLSYAWKIGTGVENRTLLRLFVGQRPSPEGDPGVTKTNLAPRAGFEPARDLGNSQVPFQLGYLGMKMVGDPGRGSQPAA
jgi:hypothetical protein